MNHDQTTKILVVDDEPVVCELLSRWLTSAGYSCDVASNGEAAIELLKREQHHLVVSDVMMPGMSGLSHYLWKTKCVNLLQQHDQYFFLLNNFLFVSTYLLTLKHQV